MRKEEIEERIKYAKSDFTDGIEILIEIIDQLEQENKALKSDLDSNIKLCFDKDGDIGKMFRYKRR